MSVAGRPGPAGGVRRLRLDAPSTTSSAASRRWRAPRALPMGIRMVAHAIIAFGTPEQKDSLPAPHPDRRGVLLPGLPGLRPARTWRRCPCRPSTTATTSSARVRRSGPRTPVRPTGSSRWCAPRGERRQQGITFVLIDMTTPGIEIRLLVMTSGEKIQNQIFFDAVRCPRTTSSAASTTAGRWPSICWSSNAAAAPPRRPAGDGESVAAHAGGLADDAAFAAKLRRRPDPHRGAGDPRVPGADHGRRGPQPGCGVVDAEDPVDRTPARRSPNSRWRRRVRVDGSTNRTPPLPGRSGVGFRTARRRLPVR